MDVQQPQLQPQPPQVATQAVPVNPPPVQVQHRSYGLMWTLIIFVLALFGFLGYYFLSPKMIIEVTDQQPAETIYIERLKLVQPGGLVIHRVSIDEGVVPVAITGFLPPEEYKRFQVKRIEGEAPFASGDQLYATVYIDADGDGLMDYDADKPWRDALGKPVRVDFRLQ